jgi:hypothetical protein
MIKNLTLPRIFIPLFHSLPVCIFCYHWYMEDFLKKIKLDDEVTYLASLSTQKVCQTYEIHVEISLKRR